MTTHKHLSIIDRRAFAKRLGISTAALPLLMNLTSMGWANSTRPKQRFVIIFSPNGVVPDQFWPDQEGEQFELKRILTPLAPFKDQLLTLHGVGDRIRGDGDNHMRGIGCLLTGSVLYPGNIQGGSDTPAGWASGISLDQEIKNYLQEQEQTRTRFGSLEFGVAVRNSADTWTRMCYAGPNKPIAPIDDPYRIFNRLYGQSTDRESLGSVLDDLQSDIAKIESMVSSEDRALLEDHQNLIREMEKELQASQNEGQHLVPSIDPGVQNANDNIPRLSKMQIDLMVNAMLGDFARIFSLQYTNSVGQAKMRWLGIEEDHHGLSHESDDNKEAVEKLIKINTWYCEQVAYLTKRLAETPEPGGEGSMLDHTTILWTNELGKGNSHTLEDIPFVMIGKGLGFKMNRSLKFKGTPHNRLLLSILNSFGKDTKVFGSSDHCSEGPLPLT